MARSLVLLIAVIAGSLAVLPSREGGEEAGGAAVREARAVAVPVATSERPAGALVYIAGARRLTAIDVASGRKTVRKVRSVAGCGPELAVTGGHVIFAGVRDGKTVVFSAPLALDRPPTRLGHAHAFVPSTTEGRVWLAGMDCHRNRMLIFREVSVDGRVTFATRRSGPTSWLVGALRGGLVIQRGRALLLWDPRERGEGRRLSVEAASATHGDLLAGCAEQCRRIMIVDTAAGRSIKARPSGGHRLEPDGEFSPDGTLLATPANTNDRWSVALVDTRDGSTTIIPGSQTGTTYPQLRWAASSGWLFIRARAGRILAYRPGAPRAAPTPFRLPRPYATFAAG